MFLMPLTIFDYTHKKNLFFGNLVPEQKNMVPVGAVVVVNSSWVFFLSLFCKKKLTIIPQINYVTFLGKKKIGTVDFLD